MTSDQWVLSTVTEGYRLEFTTPLFVERPAPHSRTTGPSSPCPAGGGDLQVVTEESRSTLRGTGFLHIHFLSGAEKRRKVASYLELKAPKQLRYPSDFQNHAA